MPVRHALGIEYQGSRYLGWQRLGERGPTLQQALERAISVVADEPVETVCAGRTDAGVHARCQVVHFDSRAVRDPRGWVLGITANLPPDMAVRWCVPVATDFSARFSAHARRYRYRILNRSVRPGFDRQYLGWERRPLDAALMHHAAQALVGEHDFSAFRTVHCQAAHARRNLREISVSRRDDDVVVIEVQANAFLHHMVRNIVGSLIPVGAGERPASWMAALLAGRDRTQAGPTAPAAGLAFLHPLYAPSWGLPAEVTATVAA
ncbi:tRNA pseudouridine(38-40) synthase TruA [Lysobacter pythonis]|uniref:tRNA pseudouridine synthase A n=1 Tax=Solilutibacter pythonis TaxID=2483112 RepID=A0A3M2I625_9GAMM|nr:tRNA pseudouridine(38-40) synthase TruA [Lysobacter pythonis]RMH94979.1 tRNA pseudouridine(38-40) synthase TruA [Lysobacter pythonis]